VASAFHNLVSEILTKMFI